MKALAIPLQLTNTGLSPNATMPSITLNTRLAVLALGCALLAGCSSDHTNPVAPASPSVLQATDTASATLRSGYMLSTGRTQAQQQPQGSTQSSQLSDPEHPDPQP